MGMSRQEKIAKISSMKQNKFGNPLWSDFHLLHTRHGWDDKRAVIDESLADGEGKGAKVMIKTGWPKERTDYPKGHQAAVPPGCCTSKCTCMEDWHLGEVNAGNLEQNSEGNAQLRSLAKQLVQTCEGLGFVNRRGTVSGQNFFEPTTPIRFQSSPERAHAWQCRRLLLQQLREVASRL